MSDFVALTPLIEPQLDVTFAQLAPDVQSLWKDRISFFDWDTLSPVQRRNLASQQDYEHDPATEPARQAIWDLMVERDDVQRQIDELSAAPPKSAGEVIAKEDRLKALRVIRDALENKFKHWRGDNPEAPPLETGQIRQVDSRHQKASIALTGVLLQIVLGKAAGLSHPAIFDTQDALVRYIGEKYDDLYGLSPRSLQGKFAAANKLLDEA